MRHKGPIASLGRALKRRSTDQRRPLVLHTPAMCRGGRYPVVVAKPLRPTNRFLIVVHRRRLAWRSAEAAGVGAAAGAGAALALTTALWLTGRPSSLLGAGAICAGAAGGLLWALYRRPTPFDTATQIDRQLALDDLLATAVLLSSPGAISDDPWAEVVLAQADQACAVRQAAAVFVRSLGTRAWGAIGLTLLITLLICALAASSTDLIARDARRSDRHPADAAERPAAESDQPLLAVSAVDPASSPTGFRAGQDNDAPGAAAARPRHRPRPGRPGCACPGRRPDGISRRHSRRGGRRLRHQPNRRSARSSVSPRPPGSRKHDSRRALGRQVGCGRSCARLERGWPEHPEGWR